MTLGRETQSEEFNDWSNPASGEMAKIKLVFMCVYRLEID